MIDDVRIDSDERGFELVLDGDFTEEVERYLADVCENCREPRSTHVRRRVVLAPGSSGEIRLLCRSVPGLFREGPSALHLRLPQDAAVRLLAVAQAELGPWVAEMEFQRDAYDRAAPAERAEVLHLVHPDEDLDTSDSKHPRRAELLAAGADHDRKRRKEG